MNIPIFSDVIAQLLFLPTHFLSSLQFPETSYGSGEALYNLLQWACCKAPASKDCEAFCEKRMILVCSAPTAHA